MAGILVTDFLQPQSNSGLTIVTPAGGTIASINTSGIYSNTGAVLINASGQIGAGIVNNLSMTGITTANTVTANIVTSNTVSVSNTVTFSDGTAIGTSNSLGIRNRIINGAMTINQYNSNNSTTLSTGVYFIDRFYTNINPGSGHTGQQVTTVPNGNYINSLKLTVGTGAAATTNQQARLCQSIEGYNIADLGWGTSSALSVTLSFWVQSSITGLYSIGIANDSNTLAYVATYNINAANTWQYVTITVPGPTSGTWVTNNGRGLKIAWNLGGGPAYQATPGVWTSGSTDYYTTSSTVSWISTSGATFYITGVQLEKSSVATPFEFRHYGTELSLCQRYCYVQGYANGDGAYASIATGYNSSTTSANLLYILPQDMRIIPSLTWSGNYYDLVGSGSGNALSVNPPRSSHRQLMLSATYTSGSGTTGATCFIDLNNSATWYAIFSAEL
jgi:hypothetical protein